MIKMFVDQSSKLDPSQTLVLFARDFFNIPDGWKVGRDLLETDMPDYAEFEQIKREVEDRGYAVAYKRHLHVKGAMRATATWFFSGDPMPLPSAPERW
jgi:hypothetical protein